MRPRMQDAMYSNLQRIGGLPVQLPFTESATWTAPFSGWAIVTCVGGGGSGGAARTASGGLRATGGGAGELRRGKVYVKKNRTYTITIARCRRPPPKR